MNKLLTLTIAAALLAPHLAYCCSTYDPQICVTYNPQTGTYTVDPSGCLPMPCDVISRDDDCVLPQYGQ